MSTPSSGDHISASISGPVQGQVAVGKSISQQQHIEGSTQSISEAERAELRAAFDTARDEVAAAAPPERRDAALERVNELEEAVGADEPDTTTMAYVKRWFAKNAPTAVGSVVGILVHPVVGRIVASLGDAAVSELQKLAAD
jgi:septal ring factor EnvC (AmiA/AmiB activator)